MKRHTTEMKRDSERASMTRVRCLNTTRAVPGRSDDCCASTSSRALSRWPYRRWGLGSQRAVVRRARRRPRRRQRPRRRPAGQLGSPVTLGRAGGPTPGRRTPRADRSARSRAYRRRASRVSTPTGEKVTVKKTSSTVYDKGTSRSSASAVTKGKTVLVLGKVDSTTITASQVIVAPAINLSKASANVIAFKQPNQSESKTVGQIPASYKQGTGTIVSGTAATKATEAALTIVRRRDRRSRRAPEQRRVRGPHHRRQLASSHLHDQRLQGGRRQRLNAAVMGFWDLGWPRAFRGQPLARRAAA